MDLETITLIKCVKNSIKQTPNFDVYHITKNHIKGDICSHLPVMKIDIRSATWGIEDENNIELNHKDFEWIDHMLWEDFEFFCEDVEEDVGIEIFTDMNGYRVLLGTNIYLLEYDINNKLYTILNCQENLKDKNGEDIEELEEEIKEISEELKEDWEEYKEEAKKVKKFFSLESTIRDWVKKYPDEIKRRMKEEREEENEEKEN